MCDVSAEAMTETKGHVRIGRPATQGMKVTTHIADVSEESS